MIAVDHEWNARKVYDRIDSIAESLEKEDQRSPLEVRPIGPPFEKHAIPDHFFLLSGYRRWAGLEKVHGENLATHRVPVIVQYPKNEIEARIINLRENTEHRPLRNVDLARAFSELAKKGMTDAQIAEAVSVSEAIVKKLHYAWDHLVRELRDFWATESIIKEMPLHQIWSLSQKNEDKQLRWWRKQMGIPTEDSPRMIVPKGRKHTEWKKPKHVEVRKLVRDFRIMMTRRRKGLSHYERAYLDALLWVTGEIGQKYDPWSGKGPQD